MHIYRLFLLLVTLMIFTFLLCTQAPRVSVYIPLELLQQMLDTVVPELMRSNIVDAVHAFQVCVYIYNYIYIYICVYIQLTLTLTLNPNPTTTYIE
jgi:hypothetical protein